MKDEATTPITGTVDWFDDERGVGIIAADGGAPHCAVHAGTLRAFGIASLAKGTACDSGRETSAASARLRT